MSGKNLSYLLPKKNRFNFPSNERSSKFLNGTVSASITHLYNHEGPLQKSQQEETIETTVLEESKFFRIRYRMRADDFDKRQPVDYARQLKERPPLEVEVGSRALIVEEVPINKLDNRITTTDRLVWEFIPLGPDNFGVMTIFGATGITNSFHHQLDFSITKMLVLKGVPLEEVDTIFYLQRFRELDTLED